MSSPIHNTPLMARHALNSMGPYLDLRWVEGARHGGADAGESGRLIHLRADDMGHGIVREALTDQVAMHAVRIGHAAFDPVPDARGIDDLQRHLVAAHLRALSKAKGYEAEKMLAMLVCKHPEGMAQKAAWWCRRPVVVSNSPINILRELLSWR